MCAPGASPRDVVSIWASVTSKGVRWRKKLLALSRSDAMPSGKCTALTSLIAEEEEKEVACGCFRPTSVVPLSSWRWLDN